MEHMMKWIIYPAPSKDKIFRPGDKVFIRTKSKREIGRKGYIIDSSGSEGVNEIETKKSGDKRLHVKIPITGRAKQTPEKGTAAIEDEHSFYTASFRPVRLVSIFDTSVNNTVILTKTTDKYRLLAASQLNQNDHVLEIGCSNGECSLVISKYVNEGSLIGFDVSQEMIAQAEGKMSTDSINNTGHDHVHFHTVDPFTQSRKALLLSTVEEKSLGAREEKVEDTNEKKSERNKPTVVFIDIGGNRDLDSVIRMLAWVKSSFSPRLIIIKSEEMAQRMEDDNEKNQKSSDEPENKRLKLCSISIEPDGRIRNGEDWFTFRLNELTSKSSLKENSTYAVNNSAPKFSHPKKAPLSLSPVDEKTPICRYYNYHKNGCHQSNCPYDHNHCHWCLQRGHIASNCQNPQV